MRKLLTRVGVPVVGVASLVAIILLWQTGVSPKTPPRNAFVAETSTTTEITDATSETVATRLANAARMRWVESGLDAQSAQRLESDVRETLASVFLSDGDRYGSYWTSRGATLSSRGAAMVDHYREFIGPGGIDDAAWILMSQEDKFHAGWARNSERGAVFSSVDPASVSTGVGKDTRPLQPGVMLSGVVTAYDSPVTPLGRTPGSPGPVQTAWIEFPASIGGSPAVLVKIEYGQTTDGVWFPIRLEVRGPGGTPLPMF